MNLSMIGVHLKSLWFYPKRFFLESPVRNEVFFALCLGIVLQWIGLGAEHLYSLLSETQRLHSSFGLWPSARDLGSHSSLSILSPFTDTLPWKELNSLQWFFETGSILLSPFWIFIKILFGAFILTPWIYLILPKQSPSSSLKTIYKAVLIILAWSQTAGLFKTLPLVGGLLSFWVQIWITITGLSERFELKTVTVFFLLLTPAFFAILFIAFLMVLLLSSLAMFF